MSYIEAMERRVSVRTYQPQLPPLELLEQVQELVRSPRVGPFGRSCRFQVLDAARTKVDLGVKLGTYGFIAGAPLFLVGAVKAGPRAELDYGFVMEELVLRLTGLGLGTCWLGGSLDRTAFGRALELGADEALPAVSPLGLPAERPTLRERLGRRLFSARARKPWGELFFKADTLEALAPQEAPGVGPLLDCVRVAPSAVNRQPWRVLVEPGRCQFFVERAFPANRYGADMQLLDLGIALAHFCLGAEELGVKVQVEGTPPRPPAGKKWEGVAVVSW